jgi:phosphate transport system protein
MTQCHALSIVRISFFIRWKLAIPRSIGEFDHMSRSVDQHLEEIKNLILTMGGSVEKALIEAMQALASGSADSESFKTHFGKVQELEKQINATQIKVDNECLAFLATQGPVARDLRLIISVIKINADLERMGDQCVNISYSSREYLGRSARAEGLAEIEKMSQVVREMVKVSLDAFVKEDAGLAKSVLLKDDEVDALKEQIFKSSAAAIKKDGAVSESALDLILMARNLERLGDHATNIAEDVIFVSTGKDIRHGKFF